MNMLWVGCFLASAVFIFLAVKNMLFASGKKVFRIVEVALYMGAACVLMYAPVFFLQYHFLTALSADMINVMRIISLDAGYLDHAGFIEEHTGTGVLNRLYMAVLGLLHFCMPLISVLALYRMLFRFYSNILVRIVNLFGWKPLYVFNEINPGTVLLANDILINGKKGSIIFAGASESDRKKEVENLGNAILHPDRIQSIPYLESRNRDTYYFFLSENENENISGAMDVIGVLTGKDKRIQQRVHFYIGTHSNEVESLLDAAQKGDIDVNLLEMEEVAVYRLFEECPLYKSARDGVISVLVTGLDPMGVSAVKAAAWAGQIAGCQLKIRVAGIGIGEKIREFQYRYPGFSSAGCLDLEFYSCADPGELLRTVWEHCSDTTYAIVTGETDMQTAETAIRLRREFLKMDGTYTVKPEIHAYIRNEEQESSLESLQAAGTEAGSGVSYELNSFGSDAKTYTWKNVLDSDYELLAKNVHMAYESLFAPSGPDIQKASVNFNLLEINKKASRAFAMHIRYKLAGLGLDCVRESNENEVDLTRILTEKKLEEMAEAEHNRWMMYLITEGWDPAELSDVEAYRKSGLSRSEKCLLMKMHPYFCSYGEMGERAAALGQEELPVSDRELVRLIPDILHDRWGTSGVRYKIVRRS